MTGVIVDPLLVSALDAVDDFYARLFRDWPEAVTHAVGDCTLSYSGDARLNGANHLFPHTPEALTDAALAEAEDFFAQHDASWTAIYTDRYTPHAEAILSARGYSPRWHSPLMVLDAPPLPLAPRPDTHVIRATTRDHLDDVVRVLREVFGTSSIVSRRIVRVAHLDDPTIRHYLIYEDGAVVTSALAAFHTSGMATIWNVGTRPAFRRQGYATAIMTAMLADLRAQGASVVALLASREGMDLYHALGFRALATTYYMGPPYRGGAVWSG